MARPRKKTEEEAVVETEQVAGDEPKAEEPQADVPEPEAEAPAEQPDESPGEERVAAVIDDVPAEPEAEAAPEEPVAEEEPPSEEASAEPEPAAEEPAPEAEPVAEEAPPAPPARQKRRSPLTRAQKKAKRAARPKPAKAAGERKPIVRLAKPEHERGRRKERRGVVVSSAMDKTIVVRVETVKPDRRYKKVVRRSTKFHAHDDRNEANVGDMVRIVETRPLSKTKNWRLAEVVEAAK